MDINENESAEVICGVLLKPAKENNTEKAQPQLRSVKHATENTMEAIACDTMLKIVD